MSHTNL